MKSNAENEYILRLWLIYKKSIPKNELFYHFFFIFKYYPILLITHNLKGFENNNFSIETIFKHCLLFSKDSNKFFITFYIEITLFIYAILLFVILTFCIIIMLYKHYAMNSEFKLYNVPSNKFAIPKHTKRFTAIASWVFLIIVSFNQFIAEHLYLGIFMLYYNQNSNENNSDINLKYLDSRLGNNKYVIAAFNLVAFLIVYLFTFGFLVLTSTRSISQKYGFKILNTTFSSVFLLLLFQAQGPYSTCLFTSDSYRNKTRLILCCVTTGILSIHMYFLSARYDFNSLFVFLWKFVRNWAMLSGFLEIILFFTVNQHLSQKMTLIKMLFELFNAFVLTYCVINYKRRQFLDLFAKRIFDEKELILSDYLMEYYDLLYAYSNGKENFLSLYAIFQNHHHQCPNENCQCYIRLRKCQSLPVNHQKQYLSKVFLSICELEILQCILSYDTKKQIDELQTFILLHVDYLSSIKKNYFLAYYLTHYYLETKSALFNIQHKQALYEIRYLLLQKFKNKTKIKAKKILKGYIYHKQPKIMSSLRYKKSIDFIQREIELEVIKKLVIYCCYDFNQVLMYKKSKLKKKKITFSCDQVMQSIRQYKLNRTHLIKRIDDYCEKNNTFQSIEMNYILQTYLSLTYKELNSKYFNRLNVNLVQDYLRNINDIVLKKSNYMILFLTNENKLIIRYASLLFIERLNYTPNELINTEFPNLLPYFISKYHFAYIKHFIGNGLLTYAKSTYIQSKQKHLIPLNIKCKALPTKLALAMIINIEEVINTNQCDNIFHAILDDHFFFQAISNEFESYFYFTIKLFNDINIDFCQFIGLKPDVISSVFKQNITELRKKRLFNQKKERFSYSLITSIKPDDYFLYKYVPEFTTKKEPVVNWLKINKAKTYKAIWLLQKYIEETGMQKEWAMKIQGLYIKLNIQGTDIGNTIINGNNTFLIKFELKHIGDMAYYLIIIKDNKILKTELTTTSIERDKTNDDSKPNININSAIILNDNDKLNEMNMTNKGYQSFNDSKASLFNPNHNSPHSSFAFKQKTELIFKPIIEISDITAQIHHTMIICFLIRIGYLILFCVLLFFNIFKPILNSEILSDSKTLYYINLYAYLLNCDIYLSSLLCLKNCLISNKIQPGEPYEYYLFKQSGNEIMEHYHQLLKHVNLMINKNQIQTIYDLLYENNPYYLILPNWNYMERNDTIGEEIYYIYYTMTKFDPITEEDCRIKELFFNGAFNQSHNFNYSDNSIHERFMFYILTNSIKRIGPLIQNITFLSNQILLDYNESSKHTVIFFNVGILLTGFILYILMITSIVLIQKVFRKEYLYLFGYHENEEEYSNEIANFKFVIENFNHQEIVWYEQHQMTGYKRNTLPTFHTKRDFVKREFQKKDKSTINKSKEKFDIKPKEKGKGKMMNEKDKNNVKKYEDKKYQSSTRMKVIIVALVVIIISFCIFTAVQMGYIFFVLSSYERRIIESKVSINFLSRVPRMSELLMYSSVSAIFNNINYMLKDPSEYNSQMISNYYNMSLDISSHSLFKIMGNSQFSYIYYQLFILRENIARLLNDKNHQHILKATTDLEKLFYQENTICIYGPKYYIKSCNLHSVKAASAVALVKVISMLTTDCRMIGDGVNLNGIVMMYESLISEFTTHYQNFYVTKINERDIKLFLSHSTYISYETVLLHTLKILHYDNCFTAEIDMETSDSSITVVEIGFTIINLLMSCGLIFFILATFVRTIKDNRDLLNLFIDYYEKILKKYKKKSKLVDCILKV